MNLSKDKLLFNPDFGQDGANLGGDSILIGISSYNLAGASKSLLRGDESGRLEAVGPLLIGQAVTMAARTIDPGVGLGASRTAGIATITTTVAHGFAIGDMVVVAGVTDSTFDGTYLVESVPTTVTFTYTNAGANTTSEGGTAYDQTRNPRPLFLGGTDPSGNMKEVHVDASGNLIVSVASGSGTQYQDGAIWSAGSYGTGAWAVRKDTAGPLTGVADGDWSPLQVDANGQLKVVADINVTQDFVYNEDAAAAGGDLGAYVLSVRQDGLAISTSLDGDFASFKVNDRGALWSVPVGTVADDATDTENPVKVGTRVRSALAAVSLTGDRADMISDMYRRLYVHDAPNRTSLATAVVVGLAAVALPAAALVGRTRIQVQNLSNKDIYLGDAAVTIASGLRVSAGATDSVEIGDQCALYAISGTAALDVRVLELA